MSFTHRPFFALLIALACIVISCAAVPDHYLDTALFARGTSKSYQQRVQSAQKTTKILSVSSKAKQFCITFLHGETPKQPYTTSTISASTSTITVRQPTVTAQATSTSTLTLTSYTDLGPPVQRREIIDENTRRDLLARSSAAFPSFQTLEHVIIEDACLLYLYHALEYPTKTVTSSQPAITQTSTIPASTTTSTQVVTTSTTQIVPSPYVTSKPFYIPIVGAYLGKGNPYNAYETKGIVAYSSTTFTDMSSALQYELITPNGSSNGVIVSRQDPNTLYDLTVDTETGDPILLVNHDGFPATPQGSPAYIRISCTIAQAPLSGGGSTSNLPTLTCQAGPDKRGTVFDTFLRCGDAPTYEVPLFYSSKNQPFPPNCLQSPMTFPIVFA